MKIFVDLHIHSCLSPCANDDMTPNNIANMAYIKGLNAIAVADHNSCGNLRAVRRVCDERGIVLLPAMEIQSKEEVHLLCYFAALSDCEEFGEEIRKQMGAIHNRPQIFGRQLLMDADDNIIGQESLLLIQSVNLNVYEVQMLAKNYGGLMVPAHINRPANSIIANLGFMPELNLSAVELAKDLPPVYDLDKNLLTLYSSDAHQLSDIMEPEFSLDAESLSPNGILEVLRNNEFKKNL